MKSLLVVCEGNICRSPMAAGVIGAALPDLRVESAGLTALIGSPADPTAVRLMAERGIDISAHRSVQLTRRMCLGAELLLVMEHAHRVRIQEMFPQARGRVFRLLEQAALDVPDPYRLGERAFRDSLLRIDEGAEVWVRRIKKIKEIQP